MRIQANYRGARCRNEFAHLSWAVLKLQAWWFYKLTLLPALPISFAISMLVHFGTNNFTAEDGVPHALPEGINKPQEDVSSAWKPSTIEEKSTAKRLRDTAPTPIQIALKKLGV